MDSIRRVIHVVRAVLLLVNIDIYIKLVVIVNAASAVDKGDFIYSINGLRDFQYAGKGVYRSGTDVGQNFSSLQRRGFCTSDPVDMQRVVHRRAGFRCLSWPARAVFTHAGSSTALLQLRSHSVRFADKPTWASRPLSIDPRCMLFFKFQVREVLAFRCRADLCLVSFLKTVFYG